MLGDEPALRLETLMSVKGRRDSRSCRASFEAASRALASSCSRSTKTSPWSVDSTKTAGCSRSSRFPHRDKSCAGAGGGRDRRRPAEAPDESSQSPASKPIEGKGMSWKDAVAESEEPDEASKKKTNARRATASQISTVT